MPVQSKPEPARMPPTSFMTDHWTVAPPLRSSVGRHQSHASPILGERLCDHMLAESWWREISYSSIFRLETCATCGTIPTATQSSWTSAANDHNWLQWRAGLDTGEYRHPAVPAQEPLLKWPGGKRKLLHQLLEIAPRHYGDYYEPFVGGGALFFALLPRRAHLSDNNADLINCYMQVRDNPHELISALQQMKNSEDDYYRIRASVPSSNLQAAARFIYLTTLSFNGIHRVNLNGVFNVPYGKKSHLEPGEPTRILRANCALQSSELRVSDFAWVAECATSGALVYLDPPYTVAHGQNGFVKYNARIFSWDDQVRLANLAAELDMRGCRVMVSNADHCSVRALYPGFFERIVTRPSVISATNDGRKIVTESVFYNQQVCE